jgi:hypothetical protein
MIWPISVFPPLDFTAGTTLGYALKPLTFLNRLSFPASTRKASRRKGVIPFKKVYSMKPFFLHNALHF